jgi:transmembrane protein 33
VCSLELEPGNATLASNLRHAEAALARAASGGGTPTATPASAASSASSGSASARRTGSGAAGASPAANGGGGGGGSSASAGGRVLLAGIPFPASRVAQGLVLARLALLALLLVFLLPGTGALGTLAYRALLLLAAATHAADVVNRCGLPTSRGDLKEWVSRAAFDPFFHLVFLPLIFAPSGSRPRLAVALLVVDFDVLHALEFLHAAAEARAPALAHRMAAAALAALPWVTRKPAADVARLSVKQRWVAVNEALFSTNALLEVVEAVTLVFGLLWASSRAPLQTLLMTQLLQFRFATSEHTRAAFRQIDGALTAVTSHPSCPAVVGRAYGALRGLLRARVQTPEEMQAAAARQAAGGGGGGAPGGGCAIM